MIKYQYIVEFILISDMQKLMLVFSNIGIFHFIFYYCIIYAENYSLLKSPLSRIIKNSLLSILKEKNKHFFFLLGCLSNVSRLVSELIHKCWNRKIGAHSKRFFQKLEINCPCEAASLMPPVCSKVLLKCLCIG